MTDEVALQRAYYERTADRYDAMHADAVSEHDFALRIMAGLLGFFGVRSVLDVGSGTGRALITLKTLAPDVRVVGLEPSAELRAIGHAKGLGRDELVDGDAQAMAYGDGAFDLVCEFGALHHIPRPDLAVGEMLRVARTAVFISDSNNFGQGSAPARALKQALDALSLWKLAARIKTRGRGYTISEGDGLAYSYSVFNDYRLIRKRCRSVHLMNTVPAGIDPYRTAPHVALLGIK
jgi:ubiquinone/menaquinone biosynthesis C-methylase UbiE